MKLSTATINAEMDLYSITFPKYKKDTRIIIDNLYFDNYELYWDFLFSKEECNHRHPYVSRYARREFR